MPKYFDYVIEGYHLYFTSHCVIEAMHVHINADSKLREQIATKLWVRNNGDTELAENRANISTMKLRKIQKFIKDNYKDMYDKWRSYSENGFYGEE